MSKPVTLYRDSREVYVPPLSPGFASQTVALAYGDYSVRGASDSLALELKWSLDDYVACCTYERDRFDTMLRGHAKYPMRAIIVAASESDARAGEYYSKANPKAVLASSYAWLADYNVATLWTGTRENAARLIEWFARRAVKKTQVGA